jgi:hypothetical protein
MNLALKSAMLALFSFAAVAHAEVQSFTFIGRVDQSTPMAPAGAVVSGTFSYDTTTKPDLNVGDASGPGYGYAAYSVQRSITVKVNGHTLSSDSTHVDVFNNSGGNVEDSVSVYGMPMTLDGTRFGEGTFGIYLGSGPGKIHVQQDTKLPRGIQVKRYDGMNYGWAAVDGSSNGTVLSFVIENVKAIDREGRHED